MTKLSPEAEQAMDVAAARYAVQTAPESADLLDKVRAMELAVKRRRAPLSALLGCLLVFGCGVPGVDPFTPDSPTEAWCEDHRCNYVEAAFDLENPEYGPEVDRALAQLASVSNEPIVRDDFGIPLRFVPVARNLEGEAVCGATIITYLRDSRDILSIEVDISTEVTMGCPELWRTVRHEVACHAIPGLAGEHTERGICAESGGGGDGVDAHSLGQMCKGLGGCLNMLN